MTPQDRYTKALSIPVGEWAKILEGTPFKRVDVNFDKGHLYLKAPGGYMVVDKDGWFNSMHREVDGRKIIESIDSYAPEVELVWEQNTEGDPFRLNCGPLEIVVYPEPDNDSGDWEWDLWMGACIIRNRVEESCDSAISAAKAAAGELIKSVIKKP